MSKHGLFNYGQDIVMAFSPPVVGCLVKKCLQKGGSWGARDPPFCKPCISLVRVGRIIRVESKEADIFLGCLWHNIFDRSRRCLYIRK